MARIGSAVETSISGDEKREIANRCIVCGSEDIFEFYKVKDAPTQAGILWRSREEALQAPVGDINLICCNNCHYIGNHAHSPSKQLYSRNDFSLEYSPLFQRFSETLVRGIVDNYQIRNKTVLDIGCGDGDFLKKICRTGNNKGIGIDPGYHPKSGRGNDENVTFIKDYYSAKYSTISADLITCRHVLNVLPDPKAFLITLRKNLPHGSDTIVYFEEPDAMYNFGQKVVWNIIYEHRSWFTKQSLTNLFRLCGFEVLDVASRWQNEYISITAKPSNGQDLIDLSHRASHDLLFLKEIAHDFQNIIASWRTQINKLRESNRKVVAWGAGARAITFLNTFDLADVVSFVVDINPDRQGMFIPCTGHKVLSPDSLRDFLPEVVIITNPTYGEEIKKECLTMGLSTDFLIL